LLILPGHFLLHSPRFRPRRRILDGDGILDRLGVDAWKALHQAQVLSRRLEAELGREVRDVDDQRVALPAPPRVAESLADGGRKMWGSTHRGDALPSLPLTRVVED